MNPQQTVYWQHLALFLFINEVQTCFDFLRICSLFEIAQGSSSGEVWERGQPARGSKAGSSRSTSPRRHRHALRDGNLARIQAPTATARPPSDLLFLLAFCEQTSPQPPQRSLRAISKGLQTPAWFLSKQIPTNLRRAPRAAAPGRITSPQLVGRRCHGNKCQSRVATDSLLPALPAPMGHTSWPPSQPPSQTPWDHTASTGGEEGEAQEDTPSPKCPMQ